MAALRLLVISIFSLCVLANANAFESKKSSDWFAQANDRMTLRVPGAASFHLHVTFKASPGEEMLGPKDKPSIIVGDGTYDEVWLEPHKWRREVTLSDYRATEVETGGARKMRASSDYVPARVMMLIDSLVTPIPRALTSKEFKDGLNWKIDEVNSGNLSLVRLSKSMGSQRAEYTNSYYFYPTTGVVAMSNDVGLVSVWSDDIEFGAKIVPREVTIKAGDRSILEAHVTIEPVDGTSIGALDIDGPADEPGRTLRPLHPTEVRMPDLSGSFSWISSQLGPSPVFSMVGTLDSRGRFRELEVLLAPNPKDAAIIMNHFRDLHDKPATIDGSPCQVRMFWKLI